MAMDIEGVHFLVTYRCNWECEHCFVWGGPANEATMTMAQLETAIDEIAGVEQIDHVYFEGGEPMLAYPIVVKAAACARGRGLDVGLVTNCYWAQTVEDARIWLAPFAELGLFDLSVSTFPYFGVGEPGQPADAGGADAGVEETSVADVTLLENAVRAARSLDVPVAALEVGAAADLSAVEMACGDPGSVMYRGRAAVELAPAVACRTPETLTSCPHEDFDAPGRAHLGADGELQLCQGISAGNVWRDGLRTIVARYDPQALPIVRELREGGPLRLAQAYGLTPEHELYADECHLCYELRSRLRDREPEVLGPDACYGVT